MNDLVLALGVPNHVLPPPTAAHGDRVYQVLVWAKGPGGPGLEAVEMALGRLLLLPTLPVIPRSDDTPGSPEGTHDIMRLKGLLLSPRKPGLGADLSERMTYAAWRWLKPEATLERLEKLREDAGLTDTDIGQFARRLIESCTELEEEHPRLALWIARRGALLEYKIATLAELPTEPPTTGANLNYSLFSALMKLGVAESGPQRERVLLESRQVASETLQQALSAAGQAVCRTLSRRPAECGFWTNLMVVAGTGILEADLFSHPRARTNAQAARGIWGEPVEGSNCLVVVAETNEEPEHLGFWLPLGLPGRNPTPGATTAYYRAKASAMFVDDLPQIGSDFPTAAHAPWSEHLRSRFRQVVFVSVPFVLELRGGQKKVPAVVNVNIDPAGERDCRRAYHEEWLRVCQREAAPLACEAYKAFALLHPGGF